MQALGFVKALLTAVRPQSSDQMYFGDSWYSSRFGIHYTIDYKKQNARSS